MALFMLATPVTGNTISRTDYINEFNNIYQNSVALISPLTANVNANSKEITNFSLETLSATPSTQKAGRLAFLTTGKQFALDDGAQIRFVPAMYSLTAGDVPMATSSNQYGKLAIGTTGQVLQVSGGLPAWTSVLNALTAVYVPTIQTTTLYATGVHSPTAMHTNVYATALHAPSAIITTMGATTIGATTIYTTGALVAGSSLTVGGGSAVTQIVTATGSCNWPPFNAAATISTTIGVTNASLTNGDVVIGCAHTALTVASVLISGRVTSAGTVTVDIYNGTGATLSPGAGTLRVTVMRHV